MGGSRQAGGLARDVFAANADGARNDHDNIETTSVAFSFHDFLGGDQYGRHDIFLVDGSCVLWQKGDDYF